MNKKLPILLALISAALFGSATPASKILLDSFAPIQLAGLLYLGAAIGVSPYYTITFICQISIIATSISKTRSVHYTTMK
jgi:hypothetical protein